MLLRVMDVVVKLGSEYFDKILQNKNVNKSEIDVALVILGREKVKLNNSKIMEQQKCNIIKKVTIFW